MDRISFISGAALGAGVMFLLDPDSGRPRRSNLGRRMTTGYQASKEFMGKAGRDLKHRAEAIRHESEEFSPAEFAPRVPVEFEGAWTPGIQLLTGLVTTLGFVYGMRAIRARHSSREQGIEDTASDLAEDPRFAEGLT